MMIKKIKNNLEKGFSLPELMVSLGIAGFISTVVFMNLKDVSKVSRLVQDNIEKVGITSTVTEGIQNSRTCALNLRGKSLSSGSLNEFKLVTKAKHKEFSVFKVNQLYGKTVVESISWDVGTDYGDGLAQINFKVVSARVKLRPSAGKAYTVVSSSETVIPIVVRYDSSNKIESCRDEFKYVSQSTVFCNSLGGDLKDPASTAPYKNVIVRNNRFDYENEQLKVCHILNDQDVNDDIDELSGKICTLETIGSVTKLSCIENCVPDCSVAKISQICPDQQVPDGCGGSCGAGTRNDDLCTSPDFIEGCPDPNTICSTSLMPVSKYGTTCPTYQTPDLGMGLSTSGTCEEPDCICGDVTEICYGAPVYDSCGKVCATGTRPVVTASWSAWSKCDESSCEQTRTCIYDNIDCTTNADDYSCNGDSSQSCYSGSCACVCKSLDEVCEGISAYISGASSCEESCGVGTKPSTDSLWGEWETVSCNCQTVDCSVTGTCSETGGGAVVVCEAEQSRSCVAPTCSGLSEVCDAGDSENRTVNVESCSD